MSKRKLVKRILRRKMRKIVRRALKRRGFRKMVRKGKHVKAINNARPKRGGIMLS